MTTLRMQAHACDDIAAFSLRTRRRYWCVSEVYSSSVPLWPLKV